MRRHQAFALPPVDVVHYAREAHRRHALPARRPSGGEHDFHFVCFRSASATMGGAHHVFEVVADHDGVALPAAYRCRHSIGIGICIGHRRLSGGAPSVESEARERGAAKLFPRVPTCRPAVPTCRPAGPQWSEFSIATPHVRLLTHFARAAAGGV